MQILIPGDKVSEEKLSLPGTINREGGTYAAVVGSFDSEKRTFTPLEDLWYPKPNDIVVGVIKGKHSSTYAVALESPYEGAIMAKYERTKFSVGDIVEAEVRDFKQYEDATIANLSRPKKLFGGVLINVKPSKVPRIIGHGNTMITQIMTLTKSQIVVGINGTIWLNGGDVGLAADAIRMIEAEAHIPGLTERVKLMLESAQAKK